MKTRSDRVGQTQILQKKLSQKFRPNKKIERIKHRLRRKGKACLSSFFRQTERATPHVSKVIGRPLSFLSGHKSSHHYGYLKVDEDMHPPSDRYRLLPYRTHHRYVCLSSRSCDHGYTDKASGYAVHSLALVADSFHMVSRLLPLELQSSQNSHQWPA